jgi:hypothetical protein
VTPTLLGRWQTRFFLNLVFGVPVIAFYMVVFDQLPKLQEFRNDTSDLGFFHMPLLLVWMTLIGFVFDVIYIALQSLRWDRDWPLAFQIAGGLVEGGLILFLSLDDRLPFVTHCDDDIFQFPIAYMSMLVPAYAFLFGPMRVLFPRWRFAGGKIVGA